MLLGRFTIPNIMYNIWLPVPGLVGVAQVEHWLSVIEYPSAFDSVVCVMWLYHPS